MEIRLGGKMSDTCKVIFSGELQQGFEPEKIIVAFSETFSVSRQKAEKLIKSGKDVVLKGGLNQERAEKYKKVLEKLGMVVRIEGKAPVNSTLGLALEPIKSDEDEQTLVMETLPQEGGIEKCPKCGSTHMANGSCLDCGVVAEKFLAFQARKQGSMACRAGKPLQRPGGGSLRTPGWRADRPQRCPRGTWLGVVGEGLVAFQTEPIRRFGGYPSLLWRQNE